VAEPSSLLDGQVTLSVAPPWSDGSVREPLGFLQTRAGWGIEILTNSLPPNVLCEANEGDWLSAEALVRAIRPDPDLETTVSVRERVGGIDALRLDVAAVPGAATCFGDRVAVAPSPYDESVGLHQPRRAGSLLRPGPPRTPPQFKT
jgi:hypothetical protein